jgi:hypothetical protein
MSCIPGDFGNNGKGVDGVVVFWVVTNRLPGQWNLGYGAAHNLRARTNNALAWTFHLIG